MGRIRAGLIMGMLWASCAATAAGEPLTFGLFPYLTPQKLTASLAPLRDHLQQAGGRPMTLASAPNYAAFLDRVRAGDFDLIFAAPHFARIAERDHGYRRVAMTTYRVRAYVIVPRDSPARSLADLRGLRIAMPPRDSMNTLLVMGTLRAAGLEPGRDVTVRDYDTNENALAAPLRGDAEAGVTGHLVWQRSGLKDRTRSLAETETVPGFMLLAHPRLPAVLVDRWRTAASGFLDTPEGKASLAASGYEAWVPIDDAAMRELDRYLQFMPK